MPRNEGFYTILCQTGRQPQNCSNPYSNQISYFIHEDFLSLLNVFKVEDFYFTGYLYINYTLYKNPGFWLVNSRCIFIFRINFVFTTAGVFAWGFNFFTLACIKPPNSFSLRHVRVKKWNTFSQIPRQREKKLNPLLRNTYRFQIWLITLFYV
jgi:hypothetical protein